MGKYLITSVNLGSSALVYTKIDEIVLVHKTIPFDGVEYLNICVGNGAISSTTSLDLTDQTLERLKEAGKTLIKGAMFFDENQEIKNAIDIQTHNDTVYDAWIVADSIKSIQFHASNKKEHNGKSYYPAVGFFRTPVYLTTESASELKKFLSNA